MNNDSSERQKTPAEAVMKDGLSMLVNAVKASNELPSAGTNYAFYNSFPTFQTLMKAQASKILTIMQKCINHQEAKGSVVESLTTRKLNDRFESLVEINDQLLEKIGSGLDEAAGIRPHSVDLVISSATTYSSKRGDRIGRFSIDSSESTTPKASASLPAVCTSTPRGSSSSRDNSSSSTPQSRVQLLAGRKVARPQLHFAEPPDNSQMPFRPRLRTKPNALRSLAESLIIKREDENSETYSFPHPYQFELEKFQPADNVLQPHKTAKTSRPMEETPLTFIKTKHALEELVKLLRQEKEIAVDLEAHSYRTYLGITCLMQISTWTNDFIVDVLSLWDHLSLLNEVFTDPKIVKVFHDASSDVLWLQRDFGLYLVNLYDTSIAARLLGDGRTGLAHLLHNHCGISTKKEYQLADWRVRPLPEPMVQYARMDTHYLLEISNRQKQLFIDRGRFDQIVTVWNLSRERCLRRYDKPQVNENSYMDVYYSVRKNFNAQQLFALRSLYFWRDEVARLEDESPAYVLPNHMLIMISDTLPREHTGVFACCNPIPSLVRKYVHDIHKLITQAREIDKKSLPEIEAPSEVDMDGIELPHDLSHTESHEPNSNLDNAKENNIVEHLSKTNEGPVVRLRSVGGCVGHGSSNSTVDPLNLYRLSSRVMIAQEAKSNGHGCLINGEARTEPKPTTHLPPPPPPVPVTMPPPSPPPPPPPPASPPNQTSGDAESFRLQKSGKKKKRKRKAIKEASGEVDDSHEDPPALQAEFQPFDYSKAKLPRSNLPKVEDRMITTKFEFDSNQGDNPTKNRGIPKRGQSKRGGKRKIRK